MYNISTLIRIIFFHLIILLTVNLWAQTDEAQIKEGTVWDDTILEIDRSGSKGADGADARRDYQNMRAAGGSDGSYGGGNGSDGHNGRNASDGEAAEKGRNAGSGQIIFQSPATGLITISGSFLGSGNQSVKAQLNSSGFFRPVARGGNGGMPGYGGWGEDGGHGGDGGDGANSRFSADGGDGGDGGRGGNAGAGHNGADAGRGGELRVGIPSNILELAWAIEPKVDGGLGGTHSEHGRVGSGGDAGSGGSPGSYQVTVTKTRTVRDSDGNTSTETYTDTETRWGSHGSSGSKGASGAEVRNALYDGKDGEDGKLIWEVLDSKGNVIEEASNRYRLNLMTFNFVDNNNGTQPDGIFEPGETGFITNIFVKNNGELTTPKGVKTRLRIKSGAYYYTKEMSFDLPEGIKPGEVFEVKESNGQPLAIPFNVMDFDLKKPTTEPFIRTERIVPVALADVIGVERRVPEFNDQKGGTKDFTIQYPVMIEPITTLPNLARGEAAKYLFKVTNISKRDFGSLSNARRHLETVIKREGGDVPADGIQFFDTDGQPLDINSGILNKIAKLKAGESTIIETVLAVSPATDSYRSAITTISNHLDRNGYDNGDDLAKVQKRVVHLKIADDYFKTPDSDFLLVTNDKLSRTAYEAWKDLAQNKLKTDIDIWDMSYKNFILFVSKLGEYNNVDSSNDGFEEFRTSLAEDFRGKTIVLMANDYTGDANNGGESRNIWNHINLRDLRSACALYGINLYVLGGKEFDRINDLYTPERIQNDLVEYTSFPELLDSLADNQRNFVSREVNENSKYWETGLSSTLSKWRFFTRPGAGVAKSHAKRLLRKAQRENPDADFVTVHRFDAERIAPVKNFSFRLPFFGTEVRPFGSIWRIGKIEIWRSVAPDIGNIVTQKAQDWDVINSDFVNSDANLLNLYMARSFKENLKDFEHYMSQYDSLTADQKSVIPVLTSALGKLLVLEQVALRSRGRLVPNSKKRIMNRLGYLESLSKLNLVLTDSIDKDLKRSVMEMMLDVVWYSRGQVRWWERFLLLNQTRNAKYSTLSHRHLKKVFYNLFGGIHSKSELKALFKEVYKEKKAHLKSLSGQGSFANVSFAAIGVEDLIDRLQTRSGVISGEDFDRQQAELDNRDARVDKNTQAYQDKRSDLIVDNPMLTNMRFQGSGGISCRAILN